MKRTSIGAVLFLFAVCAARRAQAVSCKEILNFTSQQEIGRHPGIVNKAAPPQVFTCNGRPSTCGHQHAVGDKEREQTIKLKGDNSTKRIEFRFDCPCQVGGGLFDPGKNVGEQRQVVVECKDDGANAGELLFRVTIKLTGNGDFPEVRSALSTHLSLSKSTINAIITGAKKAGAKNASVVVAKGVPSSAANSFKSAVSSLAGVVVNLQ